MAVVVDPAFADMQAAFMERHSRIFEDTEENKHEYFSVFQEWVRQPAPGSRAAAPHAQSRARSQVKTIERMIERHIRAEVPDFSLTEFIKELQ
jgi:hypothetical protein